MLTLWNPFVPVKSQSDSRMSPKTYFDKMFEDTFQTAFNDLFPITSEMGIHSHKNEDGTLAISMDVPGVSESDLTIEVADGILSVKGERKTAKSTYRISKSVSIPKEYDSDSIIAELKNGVLNLKIAAKELPAKEVKKIPITTSKEE